jgi:transposase
MHPLAPRRRAAIGLQPAGLRHSPAPAWRQNAHNRPLAPYGGRLGEGQASVVDEGDRFNLDHEIGDSDAAHLDRRATVPVVWTASRENKLKAVRRLKVSPLPDSGACVATAAVSGEKTLVELSAEFRVHPTMISNWKQELVKRAAELFARGNKAPAVGDAPKVIDDLQRKTGQPAISRVLRGGR